MTESAPQVWERIEAAFERMAVAQARTEERLTSLTAAQARTEERLESLTAAQARTEERVESLTAAQARTDQRLASLSEAQARLEQRLTEFERRTEERFAQLATAIGELQRAVAELQRAVAELQRAVIELQRADGDLLKGQLRLERSLEDLRGRFVGSELERRYQQNAPAYFGTIARGLRMVDKFVLADMLDDAGVPDPDRREVLATDLVLTGQRRADREPIYLLVEVSVGVGRHDVERAEKRARVLQQVIGGLRGQPARVIAVVAGESIDAAGRALARRLGVWQVTDGTVTPPAA